MSLKRDMESTYLSNEEENWMSREKVISNLKEGIYQRDINKRAVLIIS